MEILIWFGLFFAFVVMVCWPLFDGWFQELESEYNQEDWYDEEDD